MERGVPKSGGGVPNKIWDEMPRYQMVLARRVLETDDI